MKKSRRNKASNNVSNLESVQEANTPERDEAKIVSPIVNKSNEERKSGADAGSTTESESRSSTSSQSREEHTSMSSSNVADRQLTVSLAGTDSTTELSVEIEKEENSLIPTCASLSRMFCNAF